MFLFDSLDMSLTGNFGGPDLVTGGEGELMLLLDLGGGTRGVGVTLFTMDDLYRDVPL
jgi:hypothetical protein